MLDKDDARAGLAALLAVNLIWGLMPLYLKLIGFASPWEIVSVRVLWTIPFAMLAVAFTGGFAATWAAVRAKGVPQVLVISAACIAANWTTYVWLVADHKIMEASLAYFLTPLVNVAMGALLFQERQSRLQLGALALAAAGVAMQAFGAGGLPFGALLLCATWSAYGLVRKRAPVPAAGGLLAETLVLALPAVFAVTFLASLPKGLAFDDSLSNASLLALSGAATACPLILFAFAARRLSMTTLGLMQYISPSIQFLVGIAYGEPLGPVRLASFVLIWIGLALFVADALMRERGRSLA